MILCSLIIIGRTAVSEILLLDYFYSERDSSFFFIYIATKWQKMKQGQKMTDHGALNIFNNNRV